MNFPRTTPGTLGRARRIAVIGALAVTVFGAGASVASAGEDEQIRTKGGEVEFEATGDILRAIDTHRDGYAVGARLTWFDPVTRTLEKAWRIDPSSAGRWKSRRLAIPEGISVGLRLCYIDEGHVVKCSKEQDGEA